MAVLIKAIAILLLVSFVASVEQVQDDAGEIKFIMMLTRHGARSPTSPMPPNSTITPDKWEIYLGIL